MFGNAGLPCRGRGLRVRQDMANKRLLIVLNELTWSGAERMMQAAAGLWQQAGYEPHILVIGSEKGDFAPVLAECGYAIHLLGFSRSPLFVLYLLAFYRGGDWDAVHIHTEQAAFWHALAARLAARRCRLVRTIHNVFAFRGALRWRRSLQRWVMRHWLGVRSTAPSRSIIDNEREAFRNPVRLIPNWIHLEVPASEETARAGRASLGMDDEIKVILSVGNCSETKNHGTLLHALARLPADFPWAYLHVGTSEEEEGERALAVRLGIADRCRFLGRRDARSVLPSADVFVMPSLGEGLGLAAVEALAEGIPCVLSHVAGLRDLVPYKAAIHWCDPEKPEEIATAIGLALGGPRRCPAVIDPVRQAFSPLAGVRQLAALFAP